MSAWEKAVGKVQGHDSWFKMSSSIIFLSCLYPKRIIWKCSCQPYYSKVKCIWVKDFLTKKSCKRSLIYNTVYERRHSKLFRSCHVSWDTLYLTSSILFSNQSFALDLLSFENAINVLSSVFNSKYLLEHFNLEAINEKPWLITILSNCLLSQIHTQI